MGLFGNDKYCVICGSKSGFLGGLFWYDLADGSHICSSCRDKCTPGELKFDAMTADAVRANIAFAAENKRKAAQEFHATRQLKAGAYRNRDCIEIDENHGWFKDMTHNNGWVYDLNDIYTFHMHLVTRRPELDELANGIDWTNYTYDELPKYPEGDFLTEAKLRIYLMDNGLSVTKVEADLVPSWNPDDSELRGGYECAHEFYEFMRNYRNNQKMSLMKH
jgi:hypothetical protein